MPAFDYLVPAPRTEQPRDEFDAFVASFRPLGDVVLVEVETDEFVTPAGLVIGHADIEQSPARMGRVLAAGPGGRGKRGQRLPMPYAVGDRVCFPRGAAFAKRVIAGREIRFLREEQLEGFTVDGDEHVHVRYVS